MRDEREAFLAASGKKLVTYRALEQLLSRFADVLRAQAKEIAALKARPLQKWAGTFTEGAHYPEASIVTKGGGLWVATKATTTVPGVPGGDWRLIVKSGGAR